MSKRQGKFKVPEHWDRSGLPAWTYFNDEVLEIEKEVLFRSHWQIVCHVSDVPESGSYVAFDLVGERALVVRDAAGKVRAFHNVCRHRGSRVVGDDKGRCRGAIVCPFHGWAYNLDGSLRGAARPDGLPPLDPEEWGLKPLEMEIWHGFVFIRFKPGPQPSVGKLMQRFEAEVAPYRLDGLVPADAIEWAETLDVNWKAIRDVDNEGYHVPMAHPGLQDLYGRHYYDEPFVDGTSRSFAPFNEGPGRLWSVKNYKKLLPDIETLPQTHRRAWLYIGVFPNFVFGLYPDSVIYYQEYPISANQTQQRGGVYRHPHEDRQLRAARYLSARIDAVTAAEDQMLTIWSSEASLSSGFDGVILSDHEYGVRTYHDHLRNVIPVYNLEDEPEPGMVAELNKQLAGGKEACI